MTHESRGDHRVKLIKDESEEIEIMRAKLS